MPKQFISLLTLTSSWVALFSFVRLFVAPEKIFDTLELPYTYCDKSEIPNGYQFQTLSLEEKWMPGWKPKFNLKKGIKEYKKYLNEKS